MNLKKYFMIFKYSLKTNLAFFTDYIFSVFAFTIHILVFNALWEYILNDGSAFGYEKNELIFYIIVTEFVTYGSVKFFQKISDMVKDGTMANMLIRPIDFLLYFVLQESSSIIRILINFISAFLLSLFILNINMFTLPGIYLGIFSCILSFVISTFIQLILGLIAFYIEEVKSIWFIIQKLQLLLVFVPIDFYGKTMQKVFMLLPTTYMVYAPAKILTKFDLKEGVFLISMQVITILVLFGVTYIMEKKGVKKINVNGG